MRVCHECSDCDDSFILDVIRMARNENSGLAVALAVGWFGDSRISALIYETFNNDVKDTLDETIGNSRIEILKKELKL